MARRSDDGGVEGEKVLSREIRPSALISWCIFDWANSPIPTVVITFVFAAYFTRGVAQSPEAGTAQWGFALSLSGILVAVLSPIFGAIADEAGRRKPWILTFAILSVATTGALWFVAPVPQSVLLALILVAMCNATFEFGQVFYNAMLPEIAPRHMIGRLSGWAWGLGYAGGLACLAIGLLVFIRPDPPLFGLDKDLAEPVRATGPFVAAWFAVFAVPLFVWVPDQPSRGVTLRCAIRRGFGLLAKTARRARSHGNILRFLIARMIYIDGLNTLFAFGGIYAAGTFDMDMNEVLIFGILLNITAGVGAALFAWVDDWLGSKLTIILSIVALILLSTAVLLVEPRIWFYVLGCGIGIFIGPVQAASRSLMAHLAPPEMRTEMFGLYALSGRVTSFLGPALVGWVTAASGSQRAGMSVILVFFLVGLLLLLPVEEPGGRTSSDAHRKVQNR